MRTETRSSDLAVFSNLQKRGSFGMQAVKARLEWVQENRGEAAEVSSVDNSSASFEKRGKEWKNIWKGI